MTKGQQTVAAPASPVALRILAAAAVVFLLWWGRALLAPLCLAIFIALALNPLVARLARRMPRSLAAAVVVLFTLAVLSGAVYALADDVAAAIEGMPAAVRQFREMIQRSAADSRAPLGSIDRAIAELQRLWHSAPGGASASTDLRQELVLMGGRALAASTQAVALMFLVYFLLATGDTLRVKAVRLSGERLSQRKITAQVLEQLMSQVSYFVGYLIVSGAVVGAVTALAFSWLGVSYASLWGLAAGLLNAVPYLGPTIVMIGSSAAALLQFGSWEMALAVGGASLAITTLEGMVLSTVLFGWRVRMHPVAVFLSIMFWGWIWGPIGTFLAVPIATAFKTVVDHLPTVVKTSELLADGSPGPLTSPADGGKPD
jgi:predicted PurR-regulated permease PerM